MGLIELMAAIIPALVALCANPVGDYYATDTDTRPIEGVAMLSIVNERW